MLDPVDPHTPNENASGAAPAPRRRAARRPAGPPAAVTAPDPVASTSSTSDAGPAAAPSTLPTADAVEPSPAEVVAEAPTKPKRTRKPARQATLELDTAPVAASDAPQSQTPATDEAQAPAKTTRRRRSSTKAEPASANSDERIGESLAELAKTAAERGARAVDRVDTVSSRDDSSTTEVLDSLAAAIGGLLAPDESGEEKGEAASEDTHDADAPADADIESESSDEGDAPRRRRRRRGGRRRRRSSGEDSATESDAEGESGESGESDGDAESASAEASEESNGESSSARRRRRRRRRGEDTGDVDDDSMDIVVRVREPRRRGNVADEVTGIEGSTRMEAKKQRRREGRAAGRRRTPILSESEFLARRESVDRTMLIRQAEDYSQIAVLEDNVLVEHYVDRASAASMIGNIYLGRVQNVLPSMEAAFVDIGRGRNAVLYAGEVDWDSFGVTGPDKKVEKVFKSGQPVLVQVSKDPVGAKGARLTSHLSIPGRYVVYSPGGHLSGISRKLPEGERKRLKGILDDLIDPNASVIVRTAAEGASEDELVHDVNRLKAQWEVLESKSKTTTAPQLLYAEPDLTVRIVRDLFTADFSSMVIDGNGGPEDAYDNVDAYLRYVAPNLAERIERWDRQSNGDIFSKYRVHEQVAKALERKVFLPSGGSLIIDRTEAMTVVDVNTGKFTGTSGNLEATVTANNLEAAEEIVRQLRLRDIGGIIVIDFIDMVLPANRELLLRRLVECLGRDRTRHQVTEVTSLGLVQMTRKKIGTGLAEAFTVACETCAGRGYHVHDAPVASQAPADGGDRDSKRRGGAKSNKKKSGSRKSESAHESAPSTDSNAAVDAQPADETPAASPEAVAQA